MLAVDDHPNRYIREAIVYALNNGWMLRKSGPRAHIHGGGSFVPKPTVRAAPGLSTPPRGTQRLMPKTFGVPLIVVRIKAMAPHMCRGIEP